VLRLSGRVLSQEIVDVLDRLKALRGPGESYSDVILALTNGV